MPKKANVAPSERPKFALSELRENSYQLFGVTSAAFDGATDGLHGKYTIEEVRGIIDTWLKKEVM